MTLADFLLARIAEDEATARAASHDGNGWTDAPAGGWGNGAVETTTNNIVVYDEGRPSPEQGAHIARHDPARVLADCEAKRRIVGLQPASVQACSAYHPGQDTYHPEGHLNEVLRALALPYADHPDFREEWTA